MTPTASPRPAPQTSPRFRIPLLAFALLAFAPVCLRAQLSLTGAVDLALRNNPRVKTAQADLDRAQAALSETKNVYVPSLVAGAGLGQAYGYSPNPPTLFFLNSSSLIFNGSQRDIIRSAHAGIDAALQSLQDMRESVAEDAAITFIALDKDQQREKILGQQSDYSARFVQIVQDRFDAGRDSQLDLTTARLSAAQLHLAILHAEHDTANDRAHLARLLNISPTSLRAEGGFPTNSTVPPPVAVSLSGGYANASVSAAFANARAKQEIAFGDARYLYWPQLSTIVQYNRYATFTDAFESLNNSYENSNGGRSLPPNEYVFGVQIVIPFFDRVRKFRARESAADAARAFHEAENAQINVLDGQTRLTNAVAELQARADVAALEQQLAQQQLDVLLVQLNGSVGNAPPLTPKEEQNSRIAERQRALAVVDATFELHQAEINLLRQTGQLEDWLRGTLRSNP